MVHSISVSSVDTNRTDSNFHRADAKFKKEQTNNYKKQRKAI